MVKNLKKELTQARDKGDQLIVSGNFNLDLQSDIWSEFAEDLELENMIFQ